MGDSSVSRGVNGGHSVVGWQMVDLEDTRQLIHMSGTLAGMSGRLDSTGTVHQSTSVLPFRMVVPGSGISYTALRPPRGTRALSLKSHTTPFRHVHTLSYRLRTHTSP